MCHFVIFAAFFQHYTQRLSALRGFSERETQAFQIPTKDYKYKTNININLKPKIIAKHLLANRLFILEVMDKTIIIKSLQLYITRKNQKINRINRIILRESNLDNLSNLKRTIRTNKLLIKRAEHQILFFENFVFKQTTS